MLSFKFEEYSLESAQLLVP